MTALRPAPTTVAAALEQMLPRGHSIRLEAFDGSTAGAADAPVCLVLHNQRALAYILSAPGDLGIVRAYVAGDVTMSGVHPGDPYEALKLFIRGGTPRLPSPRQVTTLLRAVGLRSLVPPPPPPEEALPRWRRVVEGARHSKGRDMVAIQHHYDVSNRFYELVLGPSMTYTCACYATAQAGLEQAQADKYELVARKLGLRPGMRLLDVGCGWGGMARHAARHHGVQVLGVTLSGEQADWAQRRIETEGLGRSVEVRHLDYRDVTEGGFDAISSIGLTEHIGVRNYPDYFRFLHDKLRPGGRLLNHCITRRDRRAPSGSGPFIDRYIFPDGELAPAGHLVSTMQDTGFEVRHVENLREHYALTCRAWARNLAAHWEECVAEVGEGTARAWGLYLSGCSLGFEINDIQLHQVLGVRLHEDGRADFPLRPDWLS